MLVYINVLINDIIIILSLQEIAVILNVLGFSNPIPFCIAKGVGAEYIALLGYIPPLIIFTTIIGFIIGYVPMIN